MVSKGTEPVFTGGCCKSATVLIVVIGVAMGTAVVISGNCLSANIKRETCESPSKSTIQFIVLGAAAFVLLLIQTWARMQRRRARPSETGPMSAFEVEVPLMVEVIAFFSMLDLITDVTYLTTEEWANAELEAVATLSVVTPFAAISAFFMFKTCEPPCALCRHLAPRHACPPFMRVGVIAWNLGASVDRFPTFTLRQQLY